MFSIRRRLRAGLLLSLVAIMAALGAAPSAHAWYVDLSITGAGRVTEFTDADELDEHCPSYPEEGFYSPDTTPTDTLGATCTAGSGGGDYGNGWIVEYRATAAPGYTFSRWQARAGETETSVKCDGANGSSTWTGTNCRFQIWENLHTQARFVDITPPSMASLNGPNGQINGPATFTFSAHSDPTLSHFECRLVLVTGSESQLHDWQGCSTGHQEDPAPAGTEASYKLYVRAVDRSGNPSGANSWGWTVDKIRPETTLNNGPSGTTPSRSATFEFSSTSGDVDSYRCVLDAVETICGSPKSYADLPDGEHTFAVRSRDDAGNEDSTPATRTWTIDGGPPETTITSGPAQGSSTESTSATFAFGSSESGSFECQLDGAGFSACESPRAYTGLSVGAHTFQVRARDAANNLDASPDSRSWTVTAPPVKTVIPTPTPTPAPTPRPPVNREIVNATLSSGYKAFKSYTIYHRLVLRNVPRGATTAVTCTGKKCPTKRFSSGRSGNVNLGRFLKKKLRAGTTLRIQVTKPGAIGKRFVIKIRKGKRPMITITQLA